MRNFLGYDVIKLSTAETKKNYRLTVSGYGISIVKSPSTNIFISPNNTSSPPIYLFPGLNIDFEFDNLYLTIPEAIPDEEIIIYYKTSSKSEITALI